MKLNELLNAPPTLENAMTNALHLHLRRYGLLAIARRHPLLFSRLTAA